MSDCAQTLDTSTIMQVMTPCVMLNRAVYAYQQVLQGMTAGKAVVSVSFSGQSVAYQATDATLKLLVQQIERLHPSCPTPESAAIVGGKRGNVAVATMAARGCL